MGIEQDSVQVKRTQPVAPRSTKDRALAIGQATWNASRYLTNSEAISRWVLTICFLTFVLSDSQSLLTVTEDQIEQIRSMKHLVANGSYWIRFGTHYHFCVRKIIVWAAAVQVTCGPIAGGRGRNSGILQDACYAFFFCYVMARVGLTGVFFS
ncbi:uncharacterized protein JCM15063_002023 [Sporobolomyces koalae]|uniref:uncharacterized protein n=1 Tax=Sporobolomyces koalae TaxID=500713 RepID=UPI0031764EBD